MASDIVADAARRWKMLEMEDELAQASAKLIEQSNEIKRLRAALSLFACECTVAERCAIPDNCRNFQARRMLGEKP